MTYILSRIWKTERLQENTVTEKAAERQENAGMQALWEFGLINIILVLTTIAAWILQKFHLPESNIIMVYILGVLLSSYISDKKIYAVYSSLFSVLAFKFFILQNRTFSEGL